MRITLDIPDEVYASLKAEAAGEGLSIGEVIVRSIRKNLRETFRKKRGIKLPLVKSNRPGGVHLDNEMIYKIIDFP